MLTITHRWLELRSSSLVPATADVMTAWGDDEDTEDTDTDTDTGDTADEDAQQDCTDVNVIMCVDEWLNWKEVSWGGSSCFVGKGIGVGKGTGAG